jgi:hypothetical protein
MLRQQRNACKKGHEKSGETGLPVASKRTRLFIIMPHKRPGPPLAVTAITGGNVALQLWGMERPHPKSSNKDRA